MNARLTVLSLGLFWIGAVTWSCSKNEPKATPAIEKGGAQEIRVHVKGEYLPARILAKKGKPLRVVFYRDDNSACTEYVVFEDFQIKQKLAAYKETPVELMPDKEGAYSFTCGMGMLQGKLIVRK